jgi:excisionase family DNA binding protein
MAQPFKKQIVRYFTPDGQRCDSDAPGAVKHVEDSRKYYGVVPQPDGRRKQVPLCPDLARSKQLLNKLLADAAMHEHGMGDPYAAHRKRPLGDHLDGYRASLSAKGAGLSYVALVLSRLKAVSVGCGWRTLSDLSASQADQWLDQQRTSGRASVNLPQEISEFTPGETAKILGVSLSAVRESVKRLGLEATGKGKARRFPRKTVEALLDRRGQGLSGQTLNYYRAHLRSFGNWLTKARRLGENPFRHMEAEKTTMDRRHDRKELSAEELGRVLSAARTSLKSYRGLTGPDRFHLYATAAGTGFRASALGSLTPESFDLDGAVPTVTLAARNAKNRKTQVQPIPSDLAELLRKYLADKTPGQPVWGGTWAKDRRGAQMLRCDLEVAGIAYTSEGHDGVLFTDFHSLRHSYLTLGGRAGIDLRTLQELAGHSTPMLTARYSHRRLHDLAGAVEKLPNFLPTSDDGIAEAERLAATGTDGAGSGCTLVAHAVCNQGHALAFTGKDGEEEGEAQKRRNPLECQRVASPVISSHQRGRRDSNPQPPDRQSGALTN